MPRQAALGLIQKKIFISPSQEELLETIPGWDDVQQGARIIDDTPSQRTYPENCSEGSLDRVFDVSGSSLMDASQEAVEWASPAASTTPRASDAATREEDSYNEAFESDRSQSPSTTPSWSLALGCKDPKSPTSAVAPEDIEQPPLKLNMTSTNEMVDRPSTPAEPGVTTAVRTQLRLDEAAAIAEDMEEISGRAGSSFDKGDGGAHSIADVHAMPQSPNVVLVSPRGSFLPPDIQVSRPAMGARETLGGDFGAGSASTCVSLKRKDRDSPPAVSGEDPVAVHGKDGLVGEASLAAADDHPELIASNEVQDKLHTPENTAKARESSKTQRCSPLHLLQGDLDNLAKVDDREGGDRGVGIETEHTPSRVMQDKLDNLCVTDLSATDKTENEVGCSKPLFSPTSLKILMDAIKNRSVEKPEAPVAPQEGSQCSPSSPPKPPRAVQEKLDKLRSRGGKRICIDNADPVRDRFSKDGDTLPEPHLVPPTLMDAIQLRLGARPASASAVTAADLLKTALNVGITLPPPFHRNYFND